MEVTAELLSAQGLSCEQSGRFEDALQCYSDALELDADHQLSWYRRAVLNGRLSNVEAAISDMTRAIELDDRDPDAYYNRAVFHSMLEEYEDALLDCEQAIWIDSADVYYHHERANILTRLFLANDDEDAADAAIVEYGFVINHADDSCDPKLLASSYATRAKLYQSKGDFESALEDIAMAGEWLEEDPTLLACQAWCLEEMERPIESLAAIEQAISIGGDCPAFWHAMRARLLTSLGRNEEAVQHATFGLKVDSDSIACLSARGQAYYELDQFDRAVKDLTGVIELDISSSVRYVHHVRRAVAYMVWEHFPEALQDLEIAIMLAPDNPLPYRTRAEFYALTGRPDLAEEDAERAEELEAELMFLQPFSHAPHER